MSEKYELLNHKIEYIDEIHQYLVDGKKAISVTQLIKFINPSKYEFVNEKVLKKAAEKGSELHNAIEVYEELGFERDDLKEFRDYLFLKKMHQFKVIECEVPILIEYKNIFICGRLDQVQIYNDDLTLADIKRTSVLDKESVTLQLNLYRLGYQQCYKKEIKQLKAIHLNNGKRKYIDVFIDEKQPINLIERYINEQSNTNR